MGIKAFAMKPLVIGELAGIIRVKEGDRGIISCRDRRGAEVIILSKSGGRP